MFKKLLELIKQALRKMVEYQDIKDITESAEIYTVSDKMQHAIELWEQMYEDHAPWLDESTGVYSLGLAPEICASISMSVLNELNSNILEPGQEVEDVDESAEEEPATRAQYLNDTYHKNLLKTLPDNLEHAMAVGGMIIKPYISNGQIYYNYCMQGEFVPLGFTDDGVMDDVAFYDDFIEGNKRYRRVERHVWNQEDGTTTIINKAFVTEVSEITDRNIELGREIPLNEIPRWSQISGEPVTIENVEKPLFGYFRVANANNVDPQSPLGISIFSRAVSMIKRADIQFSRLDWEYEGGQMAIDVDTTATYTNTTGDVRVSQLQNRLYRKVDIGSDDTYNAFAPALRDNNYMAGLNTYKMQIEDLCKISRGTISEVQSEARTATELKILQQRSYTTIANNQKALERCLDDVIYATNALVDLYVLFADGDYTTTHEWSDSVITDTDAELAQKLQLLNAGVYSKAELRAWYCGEDVATAQTMIDSIVEDSMQLQDLFSTGENNSVEPSGKEEDDSEPNPNESEEEEENNDNSDEE